jgi:hypothetical protein
MWPQQPWFLTVMAVIANRSPSPSRALSHLPASSLVAAAKPAGPCSTSSAPVTPAEAAMAASAPASAAWSGCNGLLIPAPRKACCSPPAKVAAVAMACAVRAASQPSRTAVAVAAPKVPTVPAVCQ